jgi:hypothetical protein
VINQPPLPIWPESRHDQETLLKRGTQAYLSPDHTEIVLVLRAENGATTVKRFLLHNRIDAEVRVSLTRVPEGYRYAYTVTNSRASGDPIDVISLVIPGNVGRLQVTFDKIAGIPNWGPMVAYGPNLYARQAELTGTSLGRFIDWVADGAYPVPNSGLKPGHTLSGFKVLSSLRPGFTTAYMLGQFPDIPEDDRDYPGIDLGFMGDRRWTDAHFLTIGPMFGDSASFDEIVRNFRDGLRRAMQCGRGTDYIRDLDRAFSNAKSFQELRRDLSQLPPAKEGSFEAEVVTAVRMSIAGHPDAR